MVRSGLAKFLITVMVLLILVAVSVLAQRNDLHPSKLITPHSTNQRYRSDICGCNFEYLSSSNHDSILPVTSEAASEPKGATCSTEPQLSREVPNMHLEKLLAETNNLKYEVARKNNEIFELRTTIQFVLQHLSKLQFDHLENIPHDQQEPPTPDPNKGSDGSVLGKRSRQEISNNGAPDYSQASSNSGAPKSKRRKADHLSGTVYDYFS